MMLAAPDAETKPTPPPVLVQPAVPTWGIGALVLTGAAVWGFLWLLREQNRRDRVHLAKLSYYR